MRHPWTLVMSTAVCAALALWTDVMSTGVDLRAFGSVTPRPFSFGELSAVLLGLLGAACGVSRLSSWEVVGARPLRIQHVCWVLSTLALSVVPLLLVPWGPVRDGSPGLSDSEWYAYAYASITPYVLGVVTVVASGLVATTYLGRVVGPLATLGAFVVVLLGQSARLPVVSRLPLPGAPGVGEAGVSHPPTWALVAVALAATTAAAVLWSGTSRSAHA